jgi:hypothetical protein
MSASLKKTKRLITIVSLAIAPAVVLLPVCAQAVPITVAFSGTVTTTGSALTPTIAVGSSITGSYTFDSNATNTSANPASTGDYAVATFSATIGGFTLTTTSPTLDLFVEVGSGEYVVSGFGIGGTVNGHSLDTFGLVTSNNQVITTTALPLTPPPPAPGLSYGFDLSFGLPPSEGVVNGIITSIAVVNNVSEPEGIVLLVTVMAGLMCTRRLAKRRTSPYCPA